MNAIAELRGSAIIAGKLKAPLKRESVMRIDSLAEKFNSLLICSFVDKRVQQPIPESGSNFETLQSGMQLHRDFTHSRIHDSKIGSIGVRHWSCESKWTNLKIKS